jgi:truncated hemoglobin YjbI
MQMVRDNNNEQWLELCKRAAQEHDPTKLRALIAEITRLLARKQERVKASNPPSPK